MKRRGSWPKPLATGVVTETSAGPAHPIVEFTLPSGTKATFTDSGDISYKKGDQVGVLYLSEEPETSAHINDSGALWFDAKLSAFIALTFIVVGCCALFLRVT